MYSFFVLGIIPGTNFQITFQVWFDSLLLVIEITSISWLYHRRPEIFSRYLPQTLLVASHCYQQACLSVYTQFRAFLLSQNASWD